MHAIEDLARALELESDIVQVGVIGRPELGIPDCRRSGCLGFIATTHTAGEDLILEANGRRKFQTRGWTRDRCVEDDAAVHGRVDPDLLEPTLADCFHPYGLPDSGGARVEDAVGLGLPILLTARDVLVGRILGPNGDDVLAGTKRGVISKRNGVWPPS